MVGVEATALSLLILYCLGRVLMVVDLGATPFFQIFFHPGMVVFFGNTI
jgi:hypothetical protein